MTIAEDRWTVTRRLPLAADLFRSIFTTRLRAKINMHLRAQLRSSVAGCRSWPIGRSPERSLNQSGRFDSIVLTETISLDMRVLPPIFNSRNENLDTRRFRTALSRLVSVLFYFFYPSRHSTRAHRHLSASNMRRSADASSRGEPRVIRWRTMNHAGDRSRLIARLPRRKIRADPRLRLHGSPRSSPEAPRCRQTDVGIKNAIVHSIQRGLNGRIGAGLSKGSQCERRERDGDSAARVHGKSARQSVDAAEYTVHLGIPEPITVQLTWNPRQFVAIRLWRRLREDQFDRAEPLNRAKRWCIDSLLGCKLHFTLSNVMGRLADFFPWITLDLADASILILSLIHTYM